MISGELLEKIVYTSFRRAWEEDRGGFPPPSDIVYVTEITQCLRKSWYRRTLAEPPSDNKVVLMVMGDGAHFLLKESFPLGAGEELVEREYEGVKIRGRVDRLLEDSLIEFKTVSRIPKQPYDSHVAQSQLYMWLFNKPKAYIVYVSRSDGRVKAYEIARDEEAIASLLQRVKKFSDALKKGAIPEPEQSKLCEYCEYLNICSAREETNGKDTSATESS
ncbi:MAG: hypothetical protein DRJ52_01260 [Thermoprotei archaeon]|nr:MAG: hypothetical protein DRJ52_01260 [Thermoprotei archaeon]RLF01173.1 MAG: hypothetical protein DRJ63_00280 [Thermoprotei archaeon]HDI74370.1 Dna2/Cas4 domain-containing protein [Thermoprotei archaeon]